MHILILGGTTQASQISALLAARPDIRATMSFAGRTQNPVLPQIAFRSGGFGGVEGLSQWIQENHVTAIIDATHPFASQMPFNAMLAAQKTAVPLVALTRPAWFPESGDNWTQVADHSEAIKTLGAAPQRIFLTVGRLEINTYAIAPQHFYMVRTIDKVEPKPLPHAIWLTDRGPFTVESEHKLLVTHNAGVVVTKNSGGDATKAKLVAARQLGLPVILIARPPKPAVQAVTSADDAMKWIAQVHDISL